MKQKNRKRILSAFLALCMLCSIGFNGSPVQAEEEKSDKVITLDTAPENEFAHWTFSDVNIPNGNFGDRWYDTHTTGNTLDMTIFQGKIKFPTVGSEFVIGQFVESRYNGFRFNNDGSNLKLMFKNGADKEWTIATFDKDIAGTTLINNPNLEVAFSVEYVDTTDGLVTMKVGVFFDGKLYNGTYLTVEDIPEKYLTQTIRFQNSDTSVKWYAESIITLDTAPENEFSHWTFSDVNISNGTFGDYWNSNTQTNGKTLDKTLFQGKIKFPTVYSEFIIGQKVGESQYEGFRFYNSGSALSLIFKDTAETTLITFDPEIAGTTLINNEKLEVALSVDFTDTTNGVTMKVGVFFDGKLYNGKYLTVTSKSADYLKQTIRFKNSNTNVKWYAESIVTLDKAPESKFAHWTFSDVTIPDGTFGYYWDEGDGNQRTTGKALDKTLFQGKIKFPTVYSEFIIGQKVGESQYEGFRFLNSGSELRLMFKGTSETTIATFDSNIAGATLINNPDLEVAFSVEYMDATDGLVDMKVGVFFNGRLYNGTYLTVSDVPEEYLKQTIRFKNNDATNYKWYVESVQITLDEALESKFTPWTFTDVNIPNGIFGNYWNGNTQTTGETLNKTLFQGKIKFPTVKSEFIIGQKVGESQYEGIRLYNSGSALSLMFKYANTEWTIATFDQDIARTTLIGNEKLEVAVSVEYTKIDDGSVTMKVGVFFDGRLYNDTYLKVEDIPEEYLKQTIRFQNSDTSVKWNVESIIPTITLGSVLESKFAHWTFSDVNIPNGTFGDYWNSNTQTNGKTLDKTLFQGKIKFPTVYSEFIIGQKVGESQYEGFRFFNSGSELRLMFKGTSETTIATFDSNIAGATLINNPDLEVAFSVKYTNVTTDGLVDMKVGVFFDGKLYNGKYLTVKNVPDDYLKQTIRFKNSDATNYKWYVESLKDYETIVNPEITDSIAMNYTVTIAPYILESGEPKMTFTMNGNQTDAIVGKQLADNTYKFTYPNIMAQNIADTITASLTVGEHVKTYEYSMLDYCADVLNATTLEHQSTKQMPALKELVVDLVEYGAEVQKYRNASISNADLLTTKLASKVSSYANNDTEDDTDLSGLTGVDTKLTGDESAKYKWKSATLVLGNKVKIRCQFTATDTTNLTVKTSMGDVAFSETGTSGVYVFEIDNIYADEYAEEIQLQFYEGESAVGQTLHYSVNTYLAAKKDSTYKDLLLAINNYGDAAVKYVQASELRVLITSDIHYQDLGDLNTWQESGMTKDERLQKWVDLVNAEHAEAPLDLIVINGDLTLDYDSGNGGEVLYNKNGLIDEFVEKYVPQLPGGVPVYMMPGNHDQYGNENWKKYTGCDRQGYMVLNNSLFLFLDNYNANLDPTEPSAGTYTQTDVAYIKEMMNQYPSCDVYLIAHWFDTTNESAEFKNLVATNDRIKGLFHGHTHNAYTIDLGAEWGNKTIAQTGSFATTDEDDFWGFRELMISSHSAYSQFLKVKCPFFGYGVSRDGTDYYTSYNR